MRKGIIILLVLLFFISVLFTILPPADLYRELAGKNVSSWYIILFIILGLIVTSVIGTIEARYPREYKEADRISHTPYAKYGWYAVVFSIVFIICFYLYAFLSR